MYDLNALCYRAIEFDGYGRYFIHLVRALVQSRQVNVYPDSAHNLEMPGWMQRLRGLDTTKLTLSLMPPHETTYLPRQWLYSMYESTLLPQHWGNITNAHAERLLVPCEWCADVFKANGVKVPIHVIYGGTDPVENPVLPQPKIDSRPYTFLALGDRGSRKGWDIAWAAFTQEFKPHEDARLIVKCRPGSLHGFHAQSPDPITKKLSIWAEDVPQMRDVFAQADCVVYPARAEGWGMFPREAACSGLPVIATNYSGTAVGCENWAYPLNDYVLASAELPRDHDAQGGWRLGEWAKPRVDEVAARMRYCYENREAAQQKGADAAAWIRANQTWEHTAAQLLALIADIDGGAGLWNAAQEQPVLQQNANTLIAALG